MKNKITSIIGAVLLATAVTVQAQSSLGDGISAAWASLTSGTNWAASVAYGRSTAHMATSKGMNLAAVDLVYDVAVNTNGTAVALLAGYDCLWNSQVSQFNSVKGGLSLNQTLRPFSFIGSTFLTNIVGTLYGGELLANPQNNNSVGNLTIAGIDLDLFKFANFSFDVGGEYENRSGQGVYDGNYAIGHLAIFRRF